MKRAQPQFHHSVPLTRERRRLRSRDWPRQPRRDPHVRVIARLSELAGPDMSVIASSSRPWASATFTGAQHRVITRFAGDHAQDCATRFAEALPEAEFTISGHIVADACIDEWRQEEAAVDGAEASPHSASGVFCLRVTVLTVEDW